MSIETDLANLHALIELWEKDAPESTGANVVDYAGDVYNVIGSTGDPHIGGYTWKQLLLSYGIDGPCYVDPSAAPADSSHPHFNVGGHMTNRADGYVPHGGNCLLMPLCYWHNSSARDGQAFHHFLTTMLELTGYYQGDFAATFMARMPDKRPFALIYTAGDGWHTTNLTADQCDAALSGSWEGVGSGATPSHYVILERHRDGDKTTHSVHAKQLSL